MTDPQAWFVTFCNVFFLFLVGGRVVIATTDQVRLVSESYICCLQPQDMLQLVPVVLNKQNASNKYH